MVDFGELWRQEAALRRAPDDASAWDARARESESKYGPSAYSEEFLRRACLQPGDTVFDMGCGAGALAVPCAERGHDVLAADFSPVMLQRCAAAVPPAAPGRVETKLLSWDDDWQAAGIAPRSFDVAIASRSIATDDMEAAIAKLAHVARRRVCLTLVAGRSPRVSAALFDDLGLGGQGHQDAAFAFGIACQLGFGPEVSFIRSCRTDRFATREEAHGAYVRMLDFADVPASPQVERQVHAWVDAHLQDVPAMGTEGLPAQVEIDVPRRFLWAFVSWSL